MVLRELALPDTGDEAGERVEVGLLESIGLEGAAPFVRTMIDFLADFDPARREEALASAQERGFLAPGEDGVMQLTPSGQFELSIYLNCA